MAINPNLQLAMSKHLISITLLTIIIFFGACTEKDQPVAPPITPLDTEKNPIKFSVGQKWHYLKYFINLGNGAALTGVPDTLTQELNYHATKDTIIQGQSYLIIEVGYHETYPNTLTLNQRIGVYLGEDSIKVLEFLGGGFFVGGLLKPHKGSERLLLGKYRSQIEMREDLLKKKLAGTEFDTTVFRDLMFPIVFPLIQDSSWFVRSDNHPFEWGAIRKTYLGKEIVSVPGGTFETFKIDWGLNEFWGQTDMFFTDWVSGIGLVKRFIDYGESEWTDEIGRFLGTFNSYDLYHYMGAYNKIFDTLATSPPVSDTVKAFADQYFDPSRFLAWYHFILRDSYPGDSGGIPMIYWERSPFSHDSVFLKEYQQKTDAYYEIIGKYDQFTQGWVDVSPDMVIDSFTYIYNQNFGTDYDHRFRGFAVQSIGTASDGTPNDTTWLYYHDGDIKRPHFFGYSDRQVEYFNLWASE